MGLKMILGLVCLLCGSAFFLCSMMGSPDTPLAFFSGDDTLKDKLNDIPGYNHVMKRAYVIHACVYWAAAITAFWNSSAAIVILIGNMAVGTAVLYMVYRKTLTRYGK
ncbi:MAG: hypothetical protein ACI32N_01580 [Bulleidia sp.]